MTGVQTCALPILAVPDLPPHEIHFDQDSSARYNVLLVHGEVEDSIPRHTERVGLTIPRTVLGDPKWDYIALGDYHVYKQLAPKAFYCGAMEYTSTNPWGEIAEEQHQKLPGKWMIEWDLATSKLTPHRIKAVRDFLDLPPIDGRGMSASDLDGAIAASIGAGGRGSASARATVRPRPGWASAPSPSGAGSRRRVIPRTRRAWRTRRRPRDTGAT